jgi:hypothetical protein
MRIVSSEQDESDLFKIDIGKQVTLLATGLTGTDKVVIDIVALTSVGGPSGDPCCPGPVTLPDIGWSAPLTRKCPCDYPEAVEMTATQPWVVLDAPQEFWLRARVVADPLSVVEVFKQDTNSKLLGL